MIMEEAFYTLNTSRAEPATLGVSGVPTSIRHFMKNLLNFFKFHNVHDRRKNTSSTNSNL